MSKSLWPWIQRWFLCSFFLTNNKHLLSHTVLVGQEWPGWTAPIWGLSWDCSQDVGRTAVILQASLGWTLLPRGATNWHRWWGGAGRWQEASVPHHVDFSTGLLERPHNMVAGFLQSEWPKTEQGRSHHVLAQASHIITSAMLVTRVFPILCGGVTKQGVNSGRQGSSGAS